MPIYSVVGKFGRLGFQNGEKGYQVYNACFKWQCHKPLTQKQMQAIRVDLNRSFYVGGVNYDVTQKFGGVLPNISQLFVSRKNTLWEVVTAPMFEVLPTTAITSQRFKLSSVEPSHYISL
jgi:hypothetical protein